MYEQQTAVRLSQGDIVDDCPILVWKLAPPPLDLDVPPEVRIIRVVVLTQACDLAQEKTTRVVATLPSRIRWHPWFSTKKGCTDVC